MNIFFQLAATFFVATVVYLGVQDSPLPGANRPGARLFRCIFWPLIGMGVLALIWQ